MKQALEEAGTIQELVSKVFTTRNLLHFAHWNTKSFAAHMALGDLYEQIVEDVDDLVEVIQGERGILSGFCTEKAEIPTDILTHIRQEASWIKANRVGIAESSSTIENLIDGLLAKYQKAIYKLTNLS
jgi:hypothetical protein